MTKYKQQGFSNTFKNAVSNVFDVKYILKIILYKTNEDLFTVILLVFKGIIGKGKIFIIESEKVEKAVLSFNINTIILFIILIITCSSSAKNDRTR